MALVKSLPVVQTNVGDEQAQCIPDPLITDIEQLNRDHAFVMNGGKAMVMNFCNDPSLGETINFSTQSDFRALYASRSTLVFGEDGQCSRVPLANQWWNHPKRRQYAGLVFMPGKPREVPSANGQGAPYFNLFRGWPVEPKAGDCSLFWAHVRNVICAGDELRYRYVRCWMAHAIQKPEEMPGTALVIVGEPGTGKGTLATTFGQLFGKHFTHVIQMDHLLGKFNAHMGESILIFGDEVTWGGNKQSVGALLGMVTEPNMMIERKGLDAMTCANYRRFIFASNEDWAVAVNKGDRRFLVLRTSDTFRANTSYFADLRAVMKNGGLQALMFDLLHEDLSNFDVRTKPEGGVAEAEMFALTLRGPSRFWYEFLHVATETSWPESVNRQSFYEQYCTTVPKGEPKVPMSVFSKNLHKMCLSIANTAPRKKSDFEMDVGTPAASSSSRDQRWVFPSLEVARTEFEKYAGQGIALWLV